MTSLHIYVNVGFYICCDVTAYMSVQTVGGSPPLKMTSNPAVTRFRRSHVAIRSFGRCGESSPDVRATSASIFDAMNVFTTSSTISGPSTSIRVATDLSDSFSVFIVRVRRSFAARSRVCFISALMSVFN